MPVVDHRVSFRNGSQIMVRGLQLGKRLGYCRNARVQVTDPNSDPNNEPWVFIVPNNELATLVCEAPAPPAWIQPGVLIRIEVDPPVVEAEYPRPTEIPDRLEAVAAVVHTSAGELCLERLLPHVVYAVDVGAVGAGLAWARLASHTANTVCGSMNFGHFLDLIVQDLRANLTVALGFEAPMFLPVASDFGDLTRARTREPAAWSFGAGAYVATVAIPLMSYTLRHIRSNLAPAPNVTLRPADWLATGSSRPQLFLWEAFVTGAAHARGANAAGLEDHLVDAATAVLAFARWEATNPRGPSDVTAQNPISTVGAAVLWSGLASDPDLLHQQTLVLRPAHLLGGGIVEYEPPPLG